MSNHQQGRENQDKGLRAASSKTRLKNKYLKQWSCIVSKHLPNLSTPQAIGLATGKAQDS
ncbi:hypothetical protein EZJ55_01830 [Microcystis aeruginosa EAWAG127a]|uniref:Uncharacterized protein n=1 Tax=Microcystis aeruginosa EAWAG127a TaxID=2529855 RepID=A0A5J5LPH8_MICAE|nr:hypothetical protein EZJ55_01830 [Microcystis aeruginosa EAWAG127a]